MQEFRFRPYPDHRSPLRLALTGALLGLLHPRMLWLTVWPFLAGFALAGVLTWHFAPLLAPWLHQVLFEGRFTATIEATLARLHLSALLWPLVPLLLFFIAFGAGVILALVFTAIFATPAVMRFVERRYPDMRRLGGGRALGSAVNALVVSVLAVVAWVLTMPLWLIPPLAVVLPWLIWAWLTMRIFRYDLLAEYATSAEQLALRQRYAGQWYVLGLTAALLNFVPPLTLFAPVFSALLYTHFTLRALEIERGSRGP